MQSGQRLAFPFIGEKVFTGPATSSDIDAE